MKRKVAVSTQKKLIFSSGGDLASHVYVGIHTHADKCMFVLIASGTANLSRV